MHELAMELDHADLMARLPTPEESDSAALATAALATALQSEGGLHVRSGDGADVLIAPAVVELVIELLGHVSNGKMVTLMPHDAVLTTQEAADLLNVSRPHLIKLLESGQIGFDKVGRHRRVPMAQLMAYRDRKLRLQQAALDEMSRLGQEFDQDEG